MPVLSNSRHEIFSQELAKGVSAVEAYVKAGFKRNEGNAIRLKGNERVLARVEELKAEAAKGVVYGLAQMREDLIAIIHGKPIEAGPEHPLCELKMSKAGLYYAFPSKTSAMEMLNKIDGNYAPEKRDITVSGIDKILTSIMHGK